MDTLVLYYIKVVVFSGVIWGAYALLLKRETFFNINRIYLLSGLIIPLLLPLAKFNISGEAGNIIYQYTLSTIEVTSTSAASEISLSWLIIGIYLTGVLFLSASFLKSLIAINKLKSTCVKTDINGSEVYVTEKNIAPFSFFNKVFLNKTELEKENHQSIIMHEKVHMIQKHSFDIIIFRVIGIIFWMNPFVWLLEKEIKSNHEFLADEGVSKNGNVLSDYFIRLVAQATGFNFELANNFNKSLILKRITMMKKQKSPVIAKWKIMLIFPVFAIFVLFFSCSPKDEQEPVINDKVSVLNSSTTDETEPVYNAGQLEVDPSFTNLTQFMIDNVKYPAAAKEKGEQGKVLVSFVVEKDGSITEAKVEQGVTTDLDNEALRVVKLMEKWQPGVVGGKTVRVKMVLPINFKLQ